METTKRALGRLAVSLLSLALLAAVLFPIFAPAKESGGPRNPRTTMKLLATCLNLYVADNDDRFPLATSWSQDRFLSEQLSMRAPDAPMPTYMRRLGGVQRSSIADPARQAVLFESTSKQVGAATNFTEVWWGKERPTHVAFADWSVRSFRYYDPAAPAEGTGVSPE